MRRFHKSRVKHWNDHDLRAERREGGSGSNKNDDFSFFPSSAAAAQVAIVANDTLDDSLLVQEEEEVTVGASALRVGVGNRAESTRVPSGVDRVQYHRLW